MLVLDALLCAPHICCLYNSCLIHYETRSPAMSESQMPGQRVIIHPWSSQLRSLPVASVWLVGSSADIDHMQAMAKTPVQDPQANRGVHDLECKQPHSRMEAPFLHGQRALAQHKAILPP
jgi:hypothetical protein